MVGSRILGDCQLFLDLKLGKQFFLQPHWWNSWKRQIDLVVKCWVWVKKSRATQTCLDLQGSQNLATRRFDDQNKGKLTNWEKTSRGKKKIFNEWQFDWNQSVDDYFSFCLGVCLLVLVIKNKLFFLLLLLMLCAKLQEEGGWQNVVIM